MDKLCRVIDNGSGISGTELDYIGDELKQAMASADVILSKGSGNMESLVGCKLNVYYIFMCKCKRMAKILGCENMSAQFLREKDLENFKPREADCSVRIQEYTREECESMVSKGLMTAALIYGPPTVSGLRTALSFQRQRICVIPKGHPLAQKQVIRIEDLKGCRIVGSLNRGAQEQLLSLCRERGFVPDFYPVEDASTMYSMCDEQGFVGLALDFSLLRSMVRAPGLIALPMDPAEFSYTVSLVAGAVENRKNAQAILEFIREIVLQRNTQTPVYPFEFA